MVIKPIHKELRPAFKGDRIKVVEALKVKQFPLTLRLAKLMLISIIKMVSW